MPKLFEPLSIKSITLKNRIVVSPMCEYSSEDGFANNWHLVHLGSRAVGGAGLIITEACAVSPEGRITPADLGIWKEEHITKLKEITDFIHTHGSAAGIQLAHAGRKASCVEPWKGGQQIAVKDGGWDTLAPSAVPFKEEMISPLALDKDGIQKVIADFTTATTHALKAGFDVIEIHAAHGYLLHEFLSPLSNFRDDEYGGSFENRIRLLIEVIESIQKAWPENLPVFVRISATDWVDNGWDINQSVQLAKVLKTLHVDLVDCSSGGNTANAKIPLEPGYQVPFAKKIKQETKILTGAVGLITNAKQAEEILNNNEADLVIMARELLRDPYFPLHAAAELHYDIEWPLQYQRAKKK